MNIIIILSIIIIVLFFIIGFTNLPSPSTVFKKEGLDSVNCNEEWPEVESTDNKDDISVDKDDYPYTQLLKNYCNIKLHSRLTNSNLTSLENIYNPFSDDEYKKKITDLTIAVNTARWWVDQVFFEKSPGFYIQKNKDGTVEGRYYYSIYIIKDRVGTFETEEDALVNTFLKHLEN